MERTIRVAFGFFIIITNLSYALMFCEETLVKETIHTGQFQREYINGYWRIVDTRDVIKNSTVTCSDVQNFIEIVIPNRIEDQGKYDIYLIIKDSNIPTINALPSTFSIFARLHADGNLIKTITRGAFNRMETLEELYLDHNQLQEISNGIFNSLIKLEVLDLSHNQIKVVKEKSLIGMINLRELFLNDNNIKQLGNFLETHDNLVILNLSNNPLEDIEELAFPNDIRELLISNTNLENFGDSNNNSMSISSFNISWSKIKYVDFSKFPLATSLDCSHNEINVVPNWEIADSLLTLNLNHNKLTILENLELGAKKDILTLDLSFNSITTIDENFFWNYPDLKKLYLQNNKIVNLSLKTFENLEMLTELDLSKNNIVNLEAGIFRKLSSLEVLNISHNGLTHLFEINFHSLSKLRSFSFDHNQISSFKGRLLSKFLPSLRYLSIFDNPFDCNELSENLFYLKNANVLVPNYNISCIKSTYNGNNSAIGQDLSKFSREVLNSVNKAIENSKIRSFFNEDFKKTQFFQYFNRTIAENANVVSAKSKISKFFNEDFKETEFFKYFNRSNKNLEINPDFKNFSQEIVKVVETLKNIKPTAINDFKNSDFLKYFNQTVVQNSRNFLKYFNQTVVQNSREMANFSEAILKITEFLNHTTSRGGQDVAYSALKISENSPETKNVEKPMGVFVFIATMQCMLTLFAGIYLMMFVFQKIVKNRSPIPLTEQEVELSTTN